LKEDKLALDPDEALRRLGNLRKDIDELERFIGAGFVTEPPSGFPHQEPATGIEIPTKGWISYATKKPAGSEEPGWRYASDRENEVHPEVETLVDAIWEGGKVEQGGFTYTLSKDCKFLQRNRAGKSGRVKK